MEILRVENVSFTYRGAASRTLDNVSFSVEEGDFVTLCGSTGCGKTTLLRLIKRELAPRGELLGEIYFADRRLSCLTERESAQQIGFVMQSPEHQLVTDKVWHELTFTAENLNMDRSLAARRIAEVSAYLGLEGLLSRRTDELSGGQKQLVALASVLVSSPRLLLLDEPTSQLDPVAASDFIATLRRLNSDMGLTVIISEHRTEELFAVSNKLLFAHGGTVDSIDEPTRLAELPYKAEIYPFMPTSAKMFCALDGKGDCPLDVRGGRRFAERVFGERACDAEHNALKGGAGAASPCDECADTHATAGQRSTAGRATAKAERAAPVALELSDVFFRYARELPDALSSLSLSVREGEIFCIVGGNGSGKSTALAVAAGLRKPYRGQVRVFGKRLSEYRAGELYSSCLSMLMQDVQTMFTKFTVREELGGFEPPFDISHLYDSHPYDLSGGEAQLVALARVLASSPRLLLLDEPTKGLDGEKKELFVRLLKKLRSDGITVLCVTHDVEFAARCADRCAMFFGGRTVSVEETASFFADNSVYTTAARRITRSICEDAVTLDGILALFGRDMAEVTRCL